MGFALCLPQAPAGRPEDPSSNSHQERGFDIMTTTIRFNQYRCQAVGLSIVQARCLHLAETQPTDAEMRQAFAGLAQALGKCGLMELAAGRWRLTDAGRSKLEVCRSGARPAPRPDLTGSAAQ